MCGRIALFAEPGDLAIQFGFIPGDVSARYRPSWNIAPTASVLAIVAGEARRRAGIMRWGFAFNRPPGESGSSRPLFNARSETLTERPAFRAAFARRRCLIPAQGFYEWQAAGGGRKTPLWIHRPDGRPFALAGIYNESPEAAATVVTCAPNSLMSAIHNRMPVILREEDYDAWLAPRTDPAILNSFLQPREWPDLTAHPVATAVNRSTADGPDLIAPVPGAAIPLL